jgi:putative peptidoglycan lipid II flippase
MTIVPWIALHRSGDAAPPAWPRGDDRGELRGLAGRGLWAAGHLGASQIVVAATIVVAGGVTGGVVAYQIAFTFFLLPHAVLANPVYTVLYPRLATDAADGRTGAFASDVAAGLTTLALVLLPGAAVLAALADPLLRVLSIGALGTADATLVAGALAAYSVGLLGYSSGFLITRASYALGDARTPTTVYAAACAVGIVAMFAVGGGLDGRDRLVALGLVHAAVVSVASVVLLVRVARRAEHSIPVVAGLFRAGSLACAAGVASWAVVSAVEIDSRAGAAGAVLAGGIAGLAVFLAVALPTRSLAPGLELLRSGHRGTPVVGEEAIAP